MQKLLTALMLVLLSALLVPLSAVNTDAERTIQPVTMINPPTVNVNQQAIHTGSVELAYDDGIPAGPRRDDPGPDWIEYDDGNPRSLYPVQNLWSRTRFTPNADFQIWGVRFMPLNQGPNPDAECNVRIYSEDQNNHNLDEMLWEGTIEELNAWDGENMNNNWHWIEIDEDDRFEIAADQDFSIIYGPAPGGAYTPGQQGTGWWNLFDGATETRRSYYSANGVPDGIGNWTQIAGGDLLIRANGEYTGGFLDLAVRSIFNAEAKIDRRWIVTPFNEKNLFADILNEGDAVEEFTVTFEVKNANGNSVFESEVAVEGLDEGDSLIVECEDVWEIPENVGNYTIWVTVNLENDVNDENNTLGMDQIVFDQEASREMWIGYIDDNLEGSTQWNEDCGWGVRFDHPGGNFPIWITAFRIGVTANGIDCPLAIHLLDLENELAEIEVGEPAWSGTVRGDGEPFVTVMLEEDDYIIMHENESLMVTYFFANNSSFRSDNTPPIAGTAIGMPPAMMQTRNDGETYTHAHSGDYAIQVQLSGPDHGGVLTGTVVAAEDDSPLEDATVITSQNHRDHTDENGRFEFPFGPHGDFTVTVTKPGYNTTFVEDLHLEDDEELDIEISMTHPECTPSEESFTTELEPDMSAEFRFEATNTGNGILNYTVERRLPDAAEYEPWELRQDTNIEDIVDDEVLNGIVFIDDLFYVSGGNNRNDVNKIYILNRDIEQVGVFDQFMESRNGMRDLAWDGSLIWGGDESTIFGFTIDGQLEVTFENVVDDDFTCRCIAWDSERELLWVSDIHTDIYGINSEGEVATTIECPDNVAMYGMTYWKDDPDGYSLYVFNRGVNTDMLVQKINIDTGDAMDVVGINMDEQRPAGICITNQYDPYNWVMIGMVLNPDRLAIWQLDARKDWFAIEPDEGSLEPDGSDEFTLTFDSADLPINVRFEGSLAFNNDTQGEPTVIPVTLSVEEGRVHTHRILHLHIGWNLVSVNIQPDDEENIPGLLAPLTDEGLLVMMKNGEGDFYRPSHEFNNIPGWYVNEGYQICVNHDCALRLEGVSVLGDDPIDLVRGWQIVAYYPRFDIEATVALSGIAEQLIIAKDGYGNFYLPEWDNFTNMGYMSQGKGYFINVNEDIQLVYQRDQGDRVAGIGSDNKSVYDKPGMLPVHAVTAENMSLLVLTDPSTEGEIGVYASGELVGSGVIQNGRCGIAVWGDDLTTNMAEGAKSGNKLEIKLLSGNELRMIAYEVLAGDLTYKTNSLAVINLMEQLDLPVDFGIVSVYPNPFNSQVRITYNLVEDAVVDLTIFDLSGRRVADLSNGKQTAGIHTALFDGEGYSSGVYVVRLESEKHHSQQKVVLVK
ncbi:T9SS type A sorting domain-containing protein [bacterium]|nr:T9SS type A sorting domain-containing protein [bacterium]